MATCTFDDLTGVLISRPRRLAIIENWLGERCHDNFLTTSMVARSVK